MHHFTFRRAATAVVAIGASIVLALVLTPGSGANAAPSAKMSSVMAAMSLAPGRGPNEFGITDGQFRSRDLRFIYTHGYFCDTSVSAQSATKCEVGQKWNHAPSTQHDPLYIAVPLGFNPGRMTECPANLTCVDHPMTLDMTRIEPALKPLYPQYTDAQLTEALKNFMTPQHDHFIADKNMGKREWWDVRVVGVTSPKVFSKIHRHGSVRYISKLIKHGNANVVGPIPTNIFLFFASRR